ncbi:zinc metallopeptidase RseP [Gimesia panareensis]|uniref:Zinc metallopeptidase RseP n=1 Tax=Gimesia panareensis TaxID=2527978 RepID=A0A518FGH4_9PLAN|nr:site-2 protease family protein [Gimesia panareensis]QDV15447.1 zinc metallopeptidase RseP [Gimesia panareensis]
MLLFLFTLLTIIAFQLIQLLYVVSSAVAGTLLGAKVEHCRVGMGPTLLRFQINDCEWSLGLLPTGASTKFANEEELLDETMFLTEDSPVKPFQALPWYSQALMILSGPCSSILAGLLLLWSATLFDGSHVVIAPVDGNFVTPSAVPNLGWEKSKADWQSNSELLQQTFVTFFIRVVTFQSLDGWGGFFGAMITCAAMLMDSPSGWFSCFGVICLGTGLLNLLPLPVLNGGYLLFLFLKLITRSELETFIERANNIGIVFILLVCARLIYADALWVYAQLFQ